MSDLKTFSDSISVHNKRVIVRLDLNVPISNSKIDDLTRIKIIEPFINRLIQNKAKVILLTHLGRPRGKIVSELSLEPIFNYLKENLNGKIFFYKKRIDNNAIEASKKINPGEALLFENIRFSIEEDNDDETFAKTLSNLGEIYINEAFSCSHRKQASIHKIVKFIESYAGPILKKEIDSIDLILKKSKKPVTCIIGGSKVSSKINVLSSLCKNTDNLIIVGAMANNFLKYKGVNIGGSLFEKDSLNTIKNLYSLAEKNNCKIIIPIDCNISRTFEGNAVNKSLNEIGSGDLILDIGKNTIDLINKIIDNSKTVFWNGPAGYYENKNFSVGSLAIASKISKNSKNKSLISVVGGGDTIAAIKNNGFEKHFTHLSTAGGAFIESLEGKELPGIKVLTKN
tara:strand:- start:4138 stop:5331 length:1194 start_codon:yes stop_codon:yes gene_type:complete